MPTESTKQVKSNQPSTKKPRQKSISLKSLQKKAVQINEWSIHVLDEKTNTIIKYNKIFDKQKVEGLIKEAYENLIYAEQHEIEFFSSDVRFMQYIYFLIIKHFTNLHNQIPSDFPSQVEAMNIIVSTGLYETMFNICFDENEVLEIVEKFKTFVSIVDQIAHLDTEVREQLLNAVESDFVKGKLESNSEV